MGGRGGKQCACRESCLGINARRAECYQTSIIRRLGPGFPPNFLTFPTLSQYPVSPNFHLINFHLIKGTD